MFIFSAFYKGDLSTQKENARPFYQNNLIYYEEKKDKSYTPRLSLSLCSKRASYAKSRPSPNLPYASYLRDQGRKHSVRPSQSSVFFVRPFSLK